jgi:hypothetical protein
LWGIDVVRFVPQDSEFNNSISQLNGFPFGVIGLWLDAISVCLCSSVSVCG